MRHAIKQNRKSATAGRANRLGRRTGQQASAFISRSPGAVIRPLPAPSGTTLSEVLVSLLIMSLGIVTLATLFPISILRSVQSSQLTNATILRYDAEAVVDTYPRLIHDPNQPLGPQMPDPNQGPPNSGPPYFANPARFVARNSYNATRYIVDPMGWTLVAPSYASAFSPDTSAAFAFGNDLPNSELTLDIVGSVVTPLTRYCGDPTLFDDQAMLQVTPSLTVAQAMARAEQNAERFVTLPDSWIFQAEDLGTPTSNTNGDAVGVTMPATVDLSSVPFQPYGIARATIFDAEGRRSQTRTITSISGQTLSWTEDTNDNGSLDPEENDGPGGIGAADNANGTLDINALPPGFPLPSSGVRVRIENRERRYSFLLTVRRSPSGPASVDVVVFFRRSFTTDDEQLYNAEFRRFDLGPDGAPGLIGVNDDDPNGLQPGNPTDDVAEIGYPGSDDFLNRRVVVNFPPPPAERPSLKKGGWILDTRNAFWYRIQDIENETNTSAELTLDEFIKRDSTEDLNASGTLDLPNEDADGNQVITRGAAILMRGVVEVFPLGTKTP